MISLTFIDSWQRKAAVVPPGISATRSFPGLTQLRHRYTPLLLVYLRWCAIAMGENLPGDGEKPTWGWGNTYLTSKSPCFRRSLVRLYSVADGRSDRCRIPH